MSTEQEQLVNDLQKEWRQNLLLQLRDLQDGQKGLVKSMEDFQKVISSQVSEMRESFAQKAEVKDLAKEVESLKAFKNKLIGLIIGSNALVAAVVYFLEKGAK